MASIIIASRANQTTTLPVLLVAHFINENRSKNQVEISLEDVNVLNKESEATVSLTSGSGSSTVGSEQVLNELHDSSELTQGDNGKKV